MLLKKINSLVVLLLCFCAVLSAQPRVSAAKQLQKASGPAQYLRSDANGEYQPSGVATLKGDLGLLVPAGQIMYGNSTSDGVASSSSFMYSNGTITNISTLPTFSQRSFSDLSYYRPTFSFMRARGTTVAPSVAQQNDLLGDFNFIPYSSIGFVHSSASFGVISRGAETASNRYPTEFYFSTTGYSTTPRDVVFVNGGGLSVGLGNVSSHLFLVSNLDIADNRELIKLNRMGKAAFAIDVTNQTLIGEAQSHFEVKNGTTKLVRIGENGQTILSAYPNAAFLKTNASGLLEAGSAASLLPTGFASATLRHDGNNWTAASNLKNNGTDIIIERDIGTPNTNTQTFARIFALKSQNGLGNSWVTDLGESKDSGGNVTYTWLKQYVPSLAGFIQTQNTTVGGGSLKMEINSGVANQSGLKLSNISSTTPDATTTTVKGLVQNGVGGDIEALTFSRGEVTPTATVISGAVTFGTPIMDYIRIGNQVFFTFKITSTSTFSSAGNIALEIDNLPFASDFTATTDAIGVLTTSATYNPSSGGVGSGQAISANINNNKLFMEFNGIYQGNLFSLTGSGSYTIK